MTVTKATIARERMGAAVCILTRPPQHAHAPLQVATKPAVTRCSGKKICINLQQISTWYRCSILVRQASFFTRLIKVITITKDAVDVGPRCMYILCDTLRCNIINVIFVQDGNYFYVAANDLRRHLIDVWVGVKQCVINDAFDQGRRRLHACVRATRGHF